MNSTCARRGAWSPDILFMLPFSYRHGVWCLYSVRLRLAWPPHSILGSLLRRAATVTDAGATSNSAPVAQLCSRQLLSQGIEMQQVHGGLAADLVYMLAIMEHSKPRRTQTRRLILEQCHHQPFSVLVHQGACVAASIRIICHVLNIMLPCIGVCCQHR
jgi:hypothetical protein